MRTRSRKRFTENSRHNFRLFSGGDEVDGTSHQPNCSSITNDQLAYTIDGVWPNSNGHARVNYVFSLPSFYWLFSPNFTTFHLQNVDATTSGDFQGTVRLVLQKFTELNNGIFSFTEVARGFKTDYSIFFRGIYYAQAATEAQFAADGEGAFTVLRFDNNGYIKQAIIYLPTDLFLYANAVNVNPAYWINYTISHETSHGLGGQHLQDFLDILAELKRIPDGVFCAVMDYPSIIGTDISNCMFNCTPPMAIYPGDCDIRSMQQAYLYHNYDHGYDKNFYYFLNAFELFMLFRIITTGYTFIDNSLSSIYKVNKPIFPRKLIHTLLNVALFGIFIGMDAPVVILTLFAISASLKLIPERVLTKSSWYQNHPGIKPLLNSRYPLYVLATATFFAEGQLPLPLFLAAAFTLLGMGGGTITGMLAHLLLEWSIKKILIHNNLLTVEETPPNQQAIEMTQLPGGNDQLAVQTQIPGHANDAENLSPISSQRPSVLVSSYLDAAHQPAEDEKNPDAPTEDHQDRNRFYQSVEYHLRRRALTAEQIEMINFDWSGLSYNPT
jgi:hypothetical protein